eukprot:5663386-Lingulodinium_polyedra.AAC.1
MVEGGLEYLRTAGPMDPLFDLLYLPLCKERGISDPPDTLAHREAMLEELQGSLFFERKGPRVALRRWFS